MSRLLSKQTSTHEHERQICQLCLNSFSSIRSLSKHEEYCSKDDKLAVLPKPCTKIEFRNHDKSMRVPFVIYADFEAFTKPIDPDYSYVNQYQQHTPCSFCYCIKSIDDSIFPPVLRCYIEKSEDDDVA